ncbi:class I SAM-dependent methyltransferase [Methylomonas koyamae]|uniref:class I SAM-dependent methyltransferase n=1 Tax=Methylomonas koyamae TaxID=702114 RepID=UPI000AA05C6C|nr:class I SAM-dependent methyltransferase [Methylomonas koyamae]BBL57503.1 tellurite resistance [Methylomonas koyamae]
MCITRWLKGDPEIYDDIVFPRAIDGALESAILRLEDRLAELSGRGTEHFIQGPNVHQKRLKNSISYYDRFADEYREGTAHLNLDHLWSQFISYLPRGGRILDAGCGVGRDTRHFIQSGFIVVSIDASWQMVLKCRENPYSYCLWMDFNELEYHEEFDAVWSCASLVHTPHDQASNFIDKFERSVKPGGIIFVSVKYAPILKSFDKNGRTFYNYDDINYSALFQTNKHLILETMWVSFSERSESNDKVKWLNIILRKL